MNQHFPGLTLASIAACVTSIKANGPFTPEQSARLNDLYDLALKVQCEIVHNEFATDDSTVVGIHIKKNRSVGGFDMRVEYSSNGDTATTFTEKHVTNISGAAKVLLSLQK